MTIKNKFYEKYQKALLACFGLNPFYTLKTNDFNRKSRKIQLLEINEIKNILQSCSRISNLNSHIKLLNNSSKKIKSLRYNSNSISQQKEVLLLAQSIKVKKQQNRESKVKLDVMAEEYELIEIYESLYDYINV